MNEKNFEIVGITCNGDWVTSDGEVIPYTQYNPTEEELKKLGMCNLKPKEKNDGNFSFLSNGETLIDTPIFILFAEYLGYVSPLIPWAENWCKPSGVCSPLQKGLLAVDARAIFFKMKKEMSIEQIKKYFTLFFDCGLDFPYAQLKLKESLSNTNNDDDSDLPF